MSAGLYKILCEQGATFQLPLVWKDASGNPVNVTGWTAQMDVRKTKQSEASIVELSTENGRITLGGDTGQIDLLIPATVTATLDPGAYVYDLDLINEQTVYRLMEGTFVVDGEVTR
jgi:hypothetical protein